MKNITKTALLLLCLVSPHILAYPQKPSNMVVGKVQKYQKTKRLSMLMLKSANEISYGFSNGSVAPRYAYYGRIIVTPEYVTLDIINQSSSCYNESRVLTAKQYSSFLSTLYSLGVKENTEEYLPLCGGGVSELIIKKGRKTLFNGTENEDIITTKGSLIDAFLPLLSYEMKKVYNDPSITFDTIDPIDPTVDIFPVDY